jgi:hypothetical protein
VPLAGRCLDKVRARIRVCAEVDGFAGPGAMGVKHAFVCVIGGLVPVALAVMAFWDGWMGFPSQPESQGPIPEPLVPSLLVPIAGIACRPTGKSNYAQIGKYDAATADRHYGWCPNG